MYIIIVLLAAILITLLGAWKVIGGLTAIVLVLALVIGALSYIFSGLTNSSFSYYCLKMIKINKLKKTIKVRGDLGYSTEEHEAELNSLRKK